MKSGSKLLLPTLFLLTLLISSGFSSEIPDMPSHYVVDLAGIIDDASEQKLNGYLQELEQKTTAQFIVLTVDSLEGRDIEGFSLEVAERWKLGQKGKDNGVLFLIALNDRKYRIEVGYGLESLLPDGYAGSIGREFLVPNFKAGNYSAGIEAASLAIIGRIAADGGVEITGMPKLAPSRGRKSSPFRSIFSLLFLIAMIILFIKHPGLFMLFLLSGGGRRSHWGGGGGGFGGGGFGSFGGGGGGGFGGGGASGSW